MSVSHLWAYNELTVKRFWGDLLRKASKACFGYTMKELKNEYYPGPFDGNLEQQAGSSVTL